MILSRVISTQFDKLVQRLVKVRGLGIGDVQTAFEAAAFGIDSNPIGGEKMIAIFARTGNKAEKVILGYINKDQLAAVGETRLFSKDADGGLKFYIWLKADGTLQLGGTTKNLARFQELESGFNQLKSDFNALVTAYNAHVHTGVTTGGGSSGPTPSSGTLSNASIAGAKIEEIKTL